MNHNITAPYQEYFKLHDASFLRIAHDDAMIAIVYKVRQPGRAPLILKICERAQDYFREVYFLKHFVGKLLVANIAGTFEPKDNIHGAILMECFPGDILKLNDLSPSLAYEIGSLLAGIHLNRAAGYGDLTQENNLSTDPRIYFASKFEESFAECESNLPKELLKQISNYYKDNINFLKDVDGPCIIHRDFRPGNIIVNNGKLQGVIDWASGRASFAEEDFCPLELGEWSLNSTIKQEFLDGYSSVRQCPIILLLCRFLN
jgi:aminoglycoside phosphotransferase (APT) family kinase protein